MESAHHQISNAIRPASPVVVLPTMIVQVVHPHLYYSKEYVGYIVLLGGKLHQLETLYAKCATQTAMCATLLCSRLIESVLSHVPQEWIQLCIIINKFASQMI